MGEKISYMFTFDSCQFHNMNHLGLPEEIKRTLTIQNAGGNSEISEALSMYYMYLKFNAYHFIPEMEVNYLFKSSICDYLMKIKNQTIGVSVTRAIGYPFNQPISMESAKTLIYKKLIGLVIAKRTVSESHYFDASVIHIWCQSWNEADILRETFKLIIEKDIYGLFGNIYVICSVCESRFIYSNS